MTFKHLAIGVYTVGIVLSASLASAATTAVTFGSPGITVTEGTTLKILSPQQATYKGEDTIYVSVEVSTVRGSLYLYLLDPNTKKVVATASYDRNALRSGAPSTLGLDLKRARAGSYIAPGAYKIAFCDIWDAKYSICAQTLGTITIAPSAPQILSIEPPVAHPGSTVFISGVGFTDNSYVLIDGGHSSLVEFRTMSYDRAALTLRHGLGYGRHTIEIASRNSILPSSNVASVNILAPLAPSLYSVTKSGDVYTATGADFNMYYPSKVEVIRTGRVIETIDPSISNSFAISADGKILKFILNSHIQALGYLSIRISNSDTKKSAIIPLL